MFAYNAKNFAIAFLVLCFLFVLPSVFWMDWQKFFHDLLNRKHVTRIGLVSLDTPADISSVIPLLLLKTLVTHDVPCALEKSVMAELSEQANAKCFSLCKLIHDN